jgi:hypothetical protein
MGGMALCMLVGEGWCWNMVAAAAASALALACPGFRRCEASAASAVAAVAAASLCCCRACRMADRLMTSGGLRPPGPELPGASADSCVPLALGAGPVVCLWVRRRQV